MLVAAIGVFDGIHAGHRKVIDALLEEAAENNSSSCIITFDRNPKDEVYKDIVIQ